MIAAPSYGCRAGGVSLVLEHWKPRCSCSQGVPSFCMGAGMGLNDGRLGGGRDGWWLMCRQRRSLLCVSEAYKAASVCDGTERQGTVAQAQCRCLLSSQTQNYFLFSVRCLTLFPHNSEPSQCSENPAALSVEMQPRLALIMS